MPRFANVTRAIHPRSWCRFSLRTLLIATGVIAVWLGWNLHQVREREQALRWIEAQGGRSMAHEPGCRPDMGEPTRHWTSPRLRRLLGDTPIYYISIVRTSATWEDRERLARLFPEADVMPEYPHRFRPRTEQPE